MPSSVDIVEKALERAHERVQRSGVDMRLVKGDVTALRDAGVGAEYRLVLDTGTFHGFDTKASLGHRAEGIRQLRAGISGLHRIGDWHHRSHWLGLLAAAYLEAGAHGDALAAIDEALEVVAATQELYHAPDLERLRGALLTRQGESDEADVCFQKALRAAASMGPKSLELRAAMSLAGMWSEQGRGAEAYDLLARVYGWFTEGFDTAELKDARSLLDQLG